jgi:hypothetical protein
VNPLYSISMHRNTVRGKGNKRCEVADDDVGRVGHVVQEGRRFRGPRRHKSRVYAASFP